MGASIHRALRTPDTFGSASFLATSQKDHGTP
jgi:hypothetical protein